jgi:hypothetical protein
MLPDAPTDVTFMIDNPTQLDQPGDSFYTVNDGEGRSTQLEYYDNFEL